LRDYRDILVLTSYGGIKWGGDFWVVFAEIDYEEAMEPVYAFRTSLIYLGFIGSVLFIALIMLLIFTITKPVSILKAASIEISNSNYSVRVPVNNNDEIGQLSSSFNFMATKIEEQRKILDKEKKKRLQTMIDWQEQERRRLSRELHDGVGQLLLSAKFRIGRINGKSNNDNEIIDDTLNILQQTVDDIKSISNDLMPSILLEFGLNKAVEDIINNISNTNKIIITFDIQLNKEPKERTSMYIYRIVQEIYNNIVKHSLAKKSELVLNENNDNIELIVSDDGIGFDLDNARTSKSHGIRNIRERVNLLNGEIKIVSKKGEGTKISIIIPKNY
jgi:signal transduction histidine kinase